MGETVFALFLIALVLWITPLFLDVTDGGNKKRRMEHTARQLARSVAEEWKNGQAFPEQEIRERDGTVYRIQLSQGRESLYVEKCQVTIRWMGIDHHEEAMSITLFRYREKEGSHE